MTTSTIKYLDSNVPTSGTGDTPATAYKTFKDAQVGIQALTPGTDVTVVVRRIHSSSESVALSNFTKIGSSKNPIMFMRYEGDGSASKAAQLPYPQVTNWDPDPTTSFPTINGNFPNTLNNLDFLQGKAYYFKGLKFLNFCPTATNGSTVGMINLGVSSQSSGPIMFEDCTLERADPVSGTVSAGSDPLINFASGSAHSFVKFINCILIAPYTITRAVGNTGSAGGAQNMVFEGCTIKFTRANSFNFLNNFLDTGTQVMGGDIIWRYCKTDPASASIDAYYRSANTGSNYLGNIYFDHCDFSPNQIAEALFTFENTGQLEFISTALSVAGYGASTEDHRVYLPNNIVFRDTTASKLRAGGTASLQKVMFVNYSNGYDGNAEYPYARLISDFTIRWDLTAISKLSWFVRPEGWTTPPTVTSAFDENPPELWFTVDYISGTNPLRVSTLKSYKDMSGTLTQNAWNELKITNGGTGFFPQAANGFLRLRMYLRRYEDTDRLLYIEPDVFISLGSSSIGASCIVTTPNINSNLGASLVIQNNSTSNSLGASITTA